MSPTPAAVQGQSGASPHSGPEASALGRRESLLFALVRRKSGLIGLGIVSVLLLVAALAPALAPHDPNYQELSKRLQPPAWSGGEAAYFLGTDQLGRDVLSRLIYGAQVSVLVSVITVLVAGCIGVLVGLLAGFFAGWVRTSLMRLVDVVLSIPYILLAVATAGVLGAGLFNMILVLSATRWVQFARVVYGQVLSLREKEFVEAARARGNGPAGILWRHILPNVATPVIVIATLELAFMVIMESSLTFLGMGVSASTPSWGSMLADGKDYLNVAWWLPSFATLAIMVTVLGVNLLGDALRDVLDPRLKV